ncbi:MAG: DNA polymerase/3'-5' exonuclease PolX [Candidatus Omnitrophica bacterium]|nr:DNA polymerase/3'-5' exonuclease PolX [Candidatus Omnitrophota bacterium]MCF7909906.1 DNA polymerase/3'-5' exonuclease PolX [Candidatus Omnitrophota bacterium]
MPIHNNEIADIFSEVADLLDIQDENQFRIRSYRNAARTIGGLSQSVAEMIKEGKDLSKLSGIGKDLAEKIETIIKKGSLPQLKKLRKKTPKSLSTIMKVASLGPKKVKAMNKKLNIKTLKDLKKAAKAGMIKELEGFGEKTEENILDNIGQVESGQKRKKIPVAKHLAEPLIAYLKKDQSLKDISTAGSYRRRKETVKDLDILVIHKSKSKIMDYFTKYEDVKKVVAKGNTKSTVKLRSDFNVDLRSVAKSNYGSALLYFTGSKAHNIAIRKIAVAKKYKLNEYGLFKGKKRVAGKTEAEVYQKLGLKYIAPELRENRGELEAAKENKLPKLVKLRDIKGDLHTHSKSTDGKNTIEEMAKAAKKIGYKYLAITDHTQNVTVAGGLDQKAFKKHLKSIERVNKKIKGITLLKGAEVDILKDGSLDLPDSVLKKLDVVVCAVHYNRNLSKAKQTKRVLKAMDNPYFQIFAHPSGRLINERKPYEIDLEKVMQKAKKKNIILELNAHPKRLDLNDAKAKRAKEMGIKIAIATDGHSTDDLKLMEYGVGQARRGWLAKKDVINTLSLTQLKKILTKRTRAKAKKR